MCGIIGYAGFDQAQEMLLEGLAHLEYRGYDSAGIAVVNGATITVEKAAGRIDNLRRLLQIHPLHGSCGIGHTRWATHGEPSDVNAHPHMDASGKIAIVHNGIIENHHQLRQMLQEEGVIFRSQTDTEVIAHLLGRLDNGDMRQTLQCLHSMLEGSYALCVLSAQEPGEIFCTRHDSPLVVGLSQGAQYVASDIPAILGHTRDMIFLQDGDIAVLSPDAVRLYNRHGDPLPLTPTHIGWSVDAAEKSGYNHFMLKEIHEEPDAISKTLHAHANLQDGKLNTGFAIDHTKARTLNRIVMTACGTAYHAAVVGKYVIEDVARIPVEVDIASEFRYRKPILNSNDLCIFLSQSGETADTLAALREASVAGSNILAITNVVGSSIARNAARNVLYTHAGPEIAVASTKAYITQVELLILLALDMAAKRGLHSAEETAQAIQQLDHLPKKARKALALYDEIDAFAARYAEAGHVFFIGRGLDYALAMEASLKLKEVSYVFSESYAAGELKHGTIALVEPGTLVIAIATQEALLDKLLSNVHEIRSRGARTVIVTMDSLRNRIAHEADEIWSVPDVPPQFAPLVAVIPLQLFAYTMAVHRGCDVDKPRNLAKSVTVE